MENYYSISVSAVSARVKILLANNNAQSLSRDSAAILSSDYKS